MSVDEALKRFEKRNRKQRNDAKLYRLEPLLSGKREELPQAPDHFIEGEIEGVVFVSVPHTATHASVTELCQKLSDTLGKRVSYITHNISLLKAKKLNPKEAAKAVKRVEDES